MKKNIGNSLYNRNGKNAAFGTRTSLEWFLDVGHHLGTMIEREAMQIARVDRSTWQRWRRGEASGATFGGKPTSAACSGRPVSSNSTEVRCMVFIDNERTVTLTF